MADHMPQAISAEQAVTTAVERFLAVVGNNDLDSLPEMFAANANISVASLSDGEWRTSTLTFAEFLADLRAETNPTLYTEPVTDFTVYVDGGHLAFVRADATLVVDGEARRHNIDYFTLIKLNGTWRFVNASYVGTPIETR